MAAAHAAPPRPILFLTRSVGLALPGHQDNEAPPSRGPAPALPRAPRGRGAAVRRARAAPGGRRRFLTSLSQGSVYRGLQAVPPANLPVTPSAARLLVTRDFSRCHCTPVHAGQRERRRVPWPSHTRQSTSDNILTTGGHLPGWRACQRGLLPGARSGPARRAAAARRPARGALTRPPAPATCIRKRSAPRQHLFPRCLGPTTSSPRRASP
jgi:hypothetical protein